MVLIGRDRNEGCLGEDVGAEGRVLGAEAVVFICLHDVDARLVLVHRVQDDLEDRKSRAQRQMLDCMLSQEKSVKAPFKTCRGDRVWLRTLTLGFFFLSCLERRKSQK